MDQSVEKSCWGVTLWAIAIVLGVVVVGSFIMGETRLSGVEASSVTTN